MCTTAERLYVPVLLLTYSFGLVGIGTSGMTTVLLGTIAANHQLLWQLHFLRIFCTRLTSLTFCHLSNHSLVFALCILYINIIQIELRWKSSHTLFSNSKKTCIPATGTGYLYPKELHSNCGKLGTWNRDNLEVACSRIKNFSMHFWLVLESHSGHYFNDLWLWQNDFNTNWLGLANNRLVPIPVEYKELTNMPFFFLCKIFSVK